MTNTEWLEIVEWVGDRFKSWTPDQAVAFYDDLHQHNAEDVWDALYRLYDKGLEFAPNGSQLRKETSLVVRERMERAKWEAQGLEPPAGSRYGVVKWLQEQGFDSFAAAVVAAHKRVYPKGCPFAGCRTCGNVDTTTLVT